MKKLIFLFMMLICAVSLNAQESKPLTYTEVVNIEGKSKNELYNAAKVWFSTSYRSSNDVLQLDNENDGVIIGKALFQYQQPFLMAYETTIGSIRYTIKLSFKDNKYKYEITDFIHDPRGNSSGYRNSFSLITTDAECPYDLKSTTEKWRNNVWDNIKEQIENNINPLILSLKEGIVKEVENENSNW